MKEKLKRNKKLIYFLLLISIVSLIPVVYLFNNGFFLSDDGEWMVIRFSAFYQTLRDGQIPPRFFGRLNHSYGYPIGNFLYPAFMYLATPLKIIGLSFADSVKAVIISSFLFSGIGSFLWLRHRFSLLAAFCGAVVYVLFPYHIYDLYVRGSIGELVAFAVLPFFLYALEKKQIILGSFFYGLLLLSHNTFAFLLTPLLLVYTHFLNNKKLFISYFLGVLLSAFFWLPSLVELPLTRFSYTAISDWKAYFLSMKTLPLVGFIGTALVGVAAYILYQRKNKEAIFFACIFLLSIIFALPVTKVIWQLEFLPKLVQFPWRLLIISVWAGSFLAAHVIQSRPERIRAFAAGVLLAVTLLSATPLIQEYKQVIRDEGYYTTNEDTTTVHQEYMPVWVKKMPEKHADVLITIREQNGIIENLSQNSYQTQFILKSSGSASLVINKIYYPGWVATVNGQEIEPGISAEGYLTLNLPAGESVVAVDFRETPLRLFSDILSLGTAILLFILFLKPKKVARAYGK